MQTDGQTAVYRYSCAVKPMTGMCEVTKEYFTRYVHDQYHFLGGKAEVKLEESSLSDPHSSSTLPEIKLV